MRKFYFSKAKKVKSYSNLKDKDISLMLQTMGLTKYESKLYLTLARMGPMKTGEIALAAHVPKRDVYRAIKELEMKGLLTEILGAPEKYVASSPADVFATEAKHCRENDLPVPDVVPVLVNFSSGENRPARKGDR
jgi:predicted DNA-binding transcriptional regulator